MTAAPASVLTERARRAVASRAATAAASHPVARVSAAHPGPLAASNAERRRTEPSRTSQYAYHPRIHDLSAPSDDGSPPAIYRVFESHAANVDATCRALHGRDWLAECIAPIVLVHGRLSAAQAARLPRRVPWLSVRGTVADTLDILRDALVAPLRDKGWICVDFMDYAAVLSYGGELRWWRSAGHRATEAAEDLVRCARANPALRECAAAWCLYVRLPLSGTMDDVDAAGRILERLLSRARSDQTLTMSVQSGHTSEFSLLLLCTLPAR